MTLHGVNLFLRYATSRLPSFWIGSAILTHAAGSLALRLYGKGDYGVLPTEEVIERIQSCVSQQKDFS